MKYIKATIVLLLMCTVIVPLLIGGLVIWQLMQTPPPPVDQSNVFHRGRIFWFALTRMDKMIKKFPWLADDEWEIFSGK